jgi:NADPH-dependent 2,4-dienoyl-CoA reductase/sulfur reductase-like enzyme
LGKAFPLTIKVSGDEYIEGGLGVGEMARVARLCQEAGLDGLTVSAGTVGGKKIEDLSQAHKVLRTLPMMTEPGCLVPIAAEIRKSLSIPVVTLGRIHQPALAESILSSGQADLVAMGRPLLADPYLPQKAFDGKEDEIRPCIACNEGCYKRILQQLDVLCSVNPGLGREPEARVTRSPHPKRVAVIGAGPAGLEAAHQAWLRGHEVTVLDRAPAVGGQLNLASIPPGREEIGRFTRFLRRRLEQTAVRVIAGREASPSAVRALEPETVILASGAKPRTPAIPGLETGRVMTAWEVLSAGMLPEGSYLILGAGLVGCETADFLSEKGKAVTVVEILPEIGQGSDGDTKTYFTLRFQKRGITVHTRTEVLRTEGREVVVRQDGREFQVEADTVVFAVGAQPEDGLWLELSTMGIPVIKAGDVVKPRRLLDSIQEGFQAGRSL